MANPLKGISRAILMSPHSVLMGTSGAICCATEISQDRPLSFINICGFISIGFAVGGMRFNLNKYRVIKQIISKKGYNFNTLDPCLNTFCSRQVLKAASKATNTYDLYKLHLKTRQMKWYQFDRDPFLNIFHPASAGLYSVSSVAYALLIHFTNDYNKL